MESILVSDDSYKNLRLVYWQKCNRCNVMIVQLIGNSQLNNKGIEFFSIKSEERLAMLRLFDCRALKETFVPKGKGVQSRLEKLRLQGAERDICTEGKGSSEQTGETSTAGR
jgi:hypothetical protein